MSWLIFKCSPTSSLSQNPFLLYLSLLLSLPPSLPLSPTILTHREEINWPTGLDNTQRTELSYILIFPDLECLAHVDYREGKIQAIDYCYGENK